ncbi:MAG: hypothetical protein HFH63_11230 [Lachnospiraceae bacterium]|nr:hypothetical protein [Lachnospiraceae bacterium]
MNRRAKISIIIGSIVFVATCMIFVIAEIEIYLSTTLGICFLLYSELVFFGGFVVVEYLADKYSQIMTRAGVGIPVEGYAIIVFLSSLIYINFLDSYPRRFLIFQIILLVITAGIALVTANASKTAKERDTEILQADLRVQEFIDRLTLIKEFIDKKADIDKLIDKIKYSDKSATVHADKELNSAILNLENTIKIQEVDISEFNKQIQEIDFLITKRNLQVRNLKQGSI